MVLVDNGSTHSFFDQKTAKELNYKVKTTFPLSVTITNGNKMYSNSRCVEFCWKMQGHKFMVDLQILKFGGCDIVLRVDWMRIASPIIFEVTFEIGGKKLTLVGSIDKGICKLISGKKLQKIFKTKVSRVAQLFSMQAPEMGSLTKAED